jgi:drug/metabolite transporter (DMT)-like permease
MLRLIVVSIIWGFSFIIIKGSLSSLDSSFVAFVRLFLSFLIFIPFMRPSGVDWLEKLQLMLIGSVQFGLMYLAYIAAFHDLPAHTIALLTTTTPIFISLFAGLYSQSNKKRAFLAAALAVAGGAVLQFSSKSLSANARGILLIQASNAAFALGQIWYRKWSSSRKKLQDKDVFGFLYAGAVLLTGIVALPHAGRFNLASVQPHQWLALLYLGVIASGLCFFLWNSGARHVSEGMLAIMNNMKIPIGVIAGLVVLKEAANAPQLLIGCALMAAALFTLKK